MQNSLQLEYIKA